MECCYHDSGVRCQCDCHKKKIMVYNFETEQIEQVSSDEREGWLDLISSQIADVVEDHEGENKSP